jgi:hypothetical protein
MRIRPRYIGLFAGPALEICLNWAVELLDRVGPFHGILAFFFQIIFAIFTILNFIICSPLILLPLRGFIAEGFLIVLWGVLGFLGGIYVERRKRRSLNDPDLPDSG